MRNSQKMKQITWFSSDNRTKSPFSLIANGVHAVVGNSAIQIGHTDTYSTLCNQHSTATVWIHPDSGYSMESSDVIISVKMNSIDITSTAYKGLQKDDIYSGYQVYISDVIGPIEIYVVAGTFVQIISTLTNCNYIDNSGANIIKGGSWEAYFIGDSVSKVTGSTVSVIMNNIDITSSVYTSIGHIYIPYLTGDVQISITAVPIVFTDNDISLELSVVSNITLTIYGQGDATVTYNGTTQNYNLDASKQASVSFSNVSSSSGTLIIHGDISGFEVPRHKDSGYKVPYTHYNFISGVNSWGDVNRICADNFSYQTALTSIVIPEGVEWIAGHMSSNYGNDETSSPFFKCTGLTSISIPSTVFYIAPASFGQTTALQSATFNQGVNEIIKLPTAGSYTDSSLGITYYTGMFYGSSLSIVNCYNNSTILHYIYIGDGVNPTFNIIT